MKVQLKKFGELDPKLQARIREQLARDDAAAARVRRKNTSRHAGLSSGLSEESKSALEGGETRKQTRRVRSDRRYRVEFIVYRRQPLDWDNASSAVKEAQDQLVRQGWLPDGDGYRELEGTSKSLKVNTKEEERVEVELTRIH